MSNGAEKFKCAAFGWVISRSNGHHLVRCAGPVYGAGPSSFRAEGYGFLSMLRFLLRLAEYCDTPQLYECTLASNNSGLITRIKDSGTVLYPAPSLSLAPDWDIINEIELACKQLQIQHPPTIQHVKGHQDREKEYHELDLISQLNGNADSTAGRFQENVSAICPIMHRMPNNNSTQLHFPPGTFNSKFKHHIRHADSAPALMEHMRNRYDWAEETTDRIDWTAHGQAIHQTLIRKLTTPNLYMIFSPPIIEYTGMTGSDPLNVHCASIRMKIEITFYNAHMPLADDGERSY